jgi:hypothetical protein
MLIKSADDKSKRLRLLEDLQDSPVLDTRQREWLKDELWRVKKGIEGERDAAFHIDSLLRDGENHAVLHDLRIQVGEDSAQIDHLVINRAGHFILIETKCFAGNVAINDAGEFTVTYGSGKRFGVPSPLAQTKRHERVLAKLLERLEIGGRFGTELRFHHLVMLHPKAIIQRPDPKRYDTTHVIKADQFSEWRERYVDAAFSGLGALGIAPCKPPGQLTPCASGARRSPGSIGPTTCWPCRSSCARKLGSAPAPASSPARLPCRRQQSPKPLASVRRTQPNA